MENKILHGDSLDLLKDMDDNSVDSIVTDPPYGYSFMGKDWDKALPSIDIWKESVRVLKPGGFAFIMSAPRSDVHSRMCLMLEEAGFRIDFTPIAWTYATGFPKAMNIGKAVDKRMGAEREVIGIKKRGDVEEAKKRGTTFTQAEANRNNKDIFGYGEEEITSGPASDKAKELDGSYAGYQPKPAWENVIVCMKPLDQKGYLDQALDNGKGVTWLDDCRIPFAGMNDSEQFEKDNVAGMMNFDGRYEKDSGKMYEGGWDKPTRTSTKSESSPLGRFTANLLVSDDILNDGIHRKSKHNPNPSAALDGNTWGGTIQTNRGPRGFDDEGSFSRYYSLDAWWEDRVKKLPEEIQRTFPFLIVPKASKSEKNSGLENNIHPTVKPLNLMSYLVTLGSRKNDVVLDPFMGSGTTPMACVTLSRNYIGIEREDEYFKIAQARVNKLENPIKQWEQWM